jgi:hypothetical protein
MILLSDLRWALYGIVYRFAIKRNPPGKSRLISLAAVLFLQSPWVAVILLVGGVVARGGDRSTRLTTRHSPMAVAVFLILMALHLVNYFWIFREDSYSAFAERRARWDQSTVRWEGVVLVLALLATVAVVPMYRWLLR